MKNSNFEKNSLQSYKFDKILEVKQYDKSKFVNAFYVNDKETWLDRNTRASLVNSTNSRIKMGQGTTALWLNGVRYELNCQVLLNLLAQLEVSALNCYDTTETHKANINNLQTIEEVKNYDYKSGYPEKLNITL
jgi:hypothetical protein